MSKKNRSSVSMNSFAALAALLPPTKQDAVEAIIDNHREEVAVTPPPAPLPAPTPAPAPTPVVDWEEEMERAAAARRKAYEEEVEAEERRRWAGMTREEYMREGREARSSYSADPAVRRREMAFDLAELEASRLPKYTAHEGVRPCSATIWGDPEYGKEAVWTKILPPRVSPEELAVAAEAAFQATLEAYASGMPEAWVEATGAAQEGRLEEWFVTADPEHGPRAYKDWQAQGDRAAFSGERTLYCPVIFRGGSEYSVPEWRLATEAERSLELTRFMVELWGQLGCPIRLSIIGTEEWAAQWVAREAERLISRIENGSTTRSLALAFEAVGSTHEEFRGEIPRVLEVAKAKALAWMKENAVVDGEHILSTAWWTDHLMVIEGSDAHLDITDRHSGAMYAWLQHGDSRNESRVATTLEWFILEELGVPYEAPARHRVSSSEWTPDADSWAGAFMSGGSSDGRRVNRRSYGGETEPRRF